MTRLVCLGGLSWSPLSSSLCPSTGMKMQTSGEGCCFGWAVIWCMPATSLGYHISIALCDDVLTARQTSLTSLSTTLPVTLLSVLPDAPVRHTLLPCDTHCTHLFCHAFFNRQTYRLDLLHMLDHHGVSSHIIATILWHHVSGERECDVLPGDIVDARLDFRDADAQAFYNTHGVSERWPKIKESHIKAPDFPELHGSGIKAGNTRAIVPYIRNLQQRAVVKIPSCSKH